LAVAEKGAGLFIDATVGAGGHAAAILEAATQSRLLGLDRDPRSLAIAQARLAHFGGRAQLHHASYTQLAELAPALGFAQADGLLFDLGIASMHVDDASRGFAFKHDGPLDMRFDPGSGLPTAADLVNTLTAEALADIFYQLGEEPESRRFARAIVAARPFYRTQALAQCLAEAAPKKPAGKANKIHPATRVFQALRIAVNDELAGLSAVLPTALALLKPGGHLAVIGFHSLEDRIVKQFMRQASSDCLCPPKQPICTCGHKAELQLLGKKPITADPDELAANPRSRSAKLRLAVKLPLVTAG
jgi:16S rRNA (cytosine1402-N4)-methyltransferase